MDRFPAWASLSSIVRRREQEFIAVCDDAMAALDKNGIDAATRSEVLGILWSMKGDVVRV